MRRRNRFEEFWFPLFLIVAGTALFLYVSFKLIVNEPVFSTGSVAAPAVTSTFDHSRCQYPSRPSNPPDGCDNSDPAIPICAVKPYPDCERIESEKAIDN